MNNTDTVDVVKRVKVGDWGYFTGKSFSGYTVRHKVRLLIGIRGSLTTEYYFFSLPYWMPTFVNKGLNKIVNLIPAI